MNLFFALTLLTSGSGAGAQDTPEIVCAARADVRDLHAMVSDLVAPARVRIDESSRCLVLLEATADQARRARELVHRLDARPAAPAPRVDLLCPAHLEAVTLESSVSDIAGRSATVRVDRATNCLILIGAAPGRSARVRRLVDDLDARAARRR
jgi:type II secretory pathway component GspD/PulD (secretin)